MSKQVEIILSHGGRFLIKSTTSLDEIKRTLSPVQIEMAKRKYVIGIQAHSVVDPLVLQPNHRRDDVFGISEEREVDMIIEGLLYKTIIYLE